MNDDLIDAAKGTIGEFIKKAKQKFDYTYDFGDGWEHEIVAEKFLPFDAETTYPTCTGGKLNCLPEDCGGIPGFYNLLDIIGNKRHPERKETLEWLGDYDAAYFDKDEINQAFALLKNPPTSARRRKKA